MRIKRKTVVTDYQTAAGTVTAGLQSLQRTVAESIPLNADGSNEDKVIITYLNPMISLQIMIKISI